MCFLFNSVETLRVGKKMEQEPLSIAGPVNWLKKYTQRAQSLHNKYRHHKSGKRDFTYVESDNIQAAIYYFENESDKLYKTVNSLVRAKKHDDIILDEEIDDVVPLALGFHLYSSDRKTKMKIPRRILKLFTTNYLAVTLKARLYPMLNEDINTNAIFAQVLITASDCNYKIKNNARKGPDWFKTLTSNNTSFPTFSKSEEDIDVEQVCKVVIKMKDDETEARVGVYEKSLEEQAEKAKQLESTLRANLEKCSKMKEAISGDIEALKKKLKMCEEGKAESLEELAKARQALDDLSAQIENTVDAMSLNEVPVSNAPSEVVQETKDQAGNAGRSALLQSITNFNKETLKPPTSESSEGEKKIEILDNLFEMIKNLRQKQGHDNPNDDDGSNDFENDVSNINAKRPGRSTEKQTRGKVISPTKASFGDIYHLVK
jgi:hypothetical protein